MPLYVVNLDIDFVVKADNEAQALIFASRQIGEIVNNDVTDEEFTVIKEVKAIKDLPFGWNPKHAIPWGQTVRPPYSMEEDIHSTFWTELDKPIQFDRERDLNE